MADLLDVDCHFYPIGSTPLHLAANNNDTKTLSQLLYSYQDLPSRINLTDGHGRTPLVVALQNGRKEAANILIQAGASLEARYRDDTTVLDVLGSERVFIPLVSSLVGTNCLAQLTQASVTPLLHSLSYEHSEDDLWKIERILQVFPALIKAKDHLGLTVLLYAVMKGNLELIRLLFRFSPDLKERNPYGSTVLHVACERGHLEVSQALLGHGGSPSSLLNTQDQLGRSPLHVAMYSKQLATIQYLVQEFGSLLDKTLRDSQGHTVVTLAFTLRFFLGLKPAHTLQLPCLSEEEATWQLHESVSHGNVEDVLTSLSQGAIVNSFDFMQQTPLLLASKLGHLEVCKALVGGGANPNVYDESLRTPIHYACKREQTEVFKYFLSLENIDLQLFYQTYDHTLTIEQIESLVCYYSDIFSPQLPQSWLEWLSLAASNQAIAPQLFFSFAQQICPPDWLQQLATGADLIARNEQVKVPRDEVSTYPVLSSLSQQVPGHTFFWGYYHQDSTDVRTSMRKTIKEINSKPLTPRKESAPFFFKKFVQIRKFPYKITHFGPRNCLKSISPGNQLAALLRCTIIYKSFSVFAALLADAIEKVPNCVSILFPQGQKLEADVCAFLDAVGENFEQLEDSLESLGIIEEVKVLFIEMKSPSELCLEKALLLYLISGSVKYRYATLKSTTVLLKPFPSWSLWYIHLRCKWLLQSLGWRGHVTFSTNEEREELASFLLENCNKDGLSDDLADTLTLDPSFLLEAVHSNCEWCVQLLLEHGASPLAHSGGKYALVQAIKHRRLPIIDALLDAWSHDSYQHHMTEELLLALCKSLLVLAMQEDAKRIDRIFSTFDLYKNKQLWFSWDIPGPRLLYVLLSSASAECVELGETLTKSAASFLCHNLLHSVDASLTRTLICSLSVNLVATRLPHKKLLRDFIGLLNISSQFPRHKLSEGEVFFHACHHGLYDVVSLYLQSLDSTDLEFLMNSNGNDALYHAASSGDFDTIQLLADTGFSPTPSMNAPLYAYFISLAGSKRLCPHRVSVCHSPKCLLHSNTGTEKQEAIVDILLPSRGYLHEVLKIKQFEFHHFAPILDLKIAERIISEVFSVYKANHALARLVAWESVVFSYSHHIAKFSTPKLKKMATLFDSFLVEISVALPFDQDACLYVVRAGMWGIANQMVLKSEQLAAAADKDRLIPVLVLAAKQGRVEILQSFYSIFTSDHWIHSETCQLIAAAARNAQAAVVEYLFSQINMKLSEALTSVVKFGDALCWALAVQQLLHSQPSAIEDNLSSLLTAASLYNRKDLLKEITPLFLSSNTVANHEEKQFLLYSTVLRAAVRHGHISLALYALDTLPKHLFHRVASDSSFHGILYWCCYWGAVEVLERLSFTPEQLLHREGPEDFTPWECALVHGHIGKISQLTNAPSLAYAMTKSLSPNNLMGFEVRDLLVGTFGKLMAGTFGQLMAISQPCDPTTFVTQCCVFGKFQSSGACNVGSEIVVAALTSLGKYAGEFICLRDPMMNFMDPVQVINAEAFEILLDALQEADLLERYISAVSTEDCEYFCKTVAGGSVQKVKALLKHGVDILACDKDCHSKPSGSLLHAAVYTKSPEMVELVLGVYGDNALDACFQENSVQEYPLYLAFALGATDVLQETSLFHSSFRASGRDLRWIAESSKAHGWFDFMMRSNKLRRKDSENDQIRSRHTFNIREESLKSKVGFILKTVKQKNFPIAVSMLAAARGFLSGTPEELASLSIEGGPGLYTCDEFLTERAKILTRLERDYHNDEQILLFIKHHGLHTNETLSVFHSSCSLNKHKVVQELLTSNEYALSQKATEEGFLLAVASGYQTTAAYISLEKNVTFDSIDEQSFPLSKNVPELPRLIFSATSYYTLLEKFFSSMCSKETLTLAGAWLAHNWTQLESQLFVQQLGNTSYAPSNPWQLPLAGESGSTSEILVTVDWDAFSESFLTSPLPDSIQAKHHCTPLLVEAVVFSPAVLGQICGDTGSNTHDSLPFFSELFKLSTLIVTAQPWSTSPSFKLYGDQGILTLSYRPTDGSILFPSSNDDDKYSMGISLPVEDSGIHSSLDGSAISSGTSEQLKELCLHFKKSLKKVVWRGAAVVVECDHGLTLSDHSSAIAQALSDTVDALKLVLVPSVLYSSVSPGPGRRRARKTISSLCGDPPLLNRLQVQLTAPDRYSYDYSSPVTITRQGKTLIINLVISSVTDMDDSLEQEGNDLEKNISVYEGLVEGLTQCLLEAEKEAGMSLVEATVSKKVIPNLSRSLRMGTLDRDFVTISLEEDTGVAHTLNDLGSISLAQVHSLVKLANFVNYFAKLLKVFSYKPKLTRGMFDGGLKVLLCDKEATSFSARGGHSLLKFSTSDLRNKARSVNMIQVFQLVLAAAASRGQRRFESIQFPSLIPAPFRCLLDSSKSNGYLYPVKNVLDILSVQLVDFNGDRLTSLPTSQCVLSVSIKDSNSSVLSANSSTDPHPKTASSNLLVKLAPEGVFQIQWTPQAVGIHDISIRLNDLPISGSPFRAYCTEYRQAGHRQVIAGSRLQFVVSHAGHSCGCVRPAVELPLSVRPLIVPKCLKAVQPFVEASKKNSEVEPATGGIGADPLPIEPPQSAESDPQSSASGVLHYISMLCRQDRSSPWLYRVDKNTAVFACYVGEKRRKLNSLTFQSTPISDGMSVVSLVSTRACVLRVFATCARCQAVLTMYWRGQVGLEPALCYVTPGPFSGATNIETDARKGRIQMTAGETKSFHIKAHDRYMNPHNIGGAIASATLEPLHSSTDLVRISPRHQELISSPESVVCDVQDNTDGTYVISFRVLVVGKYRLVINGTVRLLFEVTVSSGPPVAENCLLLLENEYELSVSQEAKCEVAMYDQCSNPCLSKKWSSVMRGEIAGQLGVVRIDNSSSNFDNVVCFKFKPLQEGRLDLEVYSSQVLLPFCPVRYTVLKFVETFKTRYEKLRSSLVSRYGNTQTPTFTVERDNILESSMQVFAIHEDYFCKHLRVRFGEEPGVDTGGVAREFYHLLSQQLVDPRYGLFQCVSGLYKPSQSSSINHNHLTFFNFFGKLLGRAIADKRLLPVRFTPSVYKYLLKQVCTLDDLKMEDPTLHKSLLTILNSETEEMLQELTVNFTAQRSHFGVVHTIELEEGGEEKSVTMANKEEFVNKLCNWHLTGCIKDQLNSLKQGLNHVVPLSLLAGFSSHELEVILSGQLEVDISFIRERATYRGYTHQSPVIEWLWEVLEEFSQEERCSFLQFATGCSSLPSAEIIEWEFKVQKGYTDSNLLPQASTCFNSITLPVYKDKHTLKQKLQLAISYGQQTFLLH